MIDEKILVERLEEQRRKYQDLAGSSNFDGWHEEDIKYTAKSDICGEIIEIVNQLAEESKNGMVMQLAMMYAVNFVKFGIDITEKYETAIRNAMVAERAYLRGRQDERDKFDKWRGEMGVSKMENANDDFCEWGHIGMKYKNCKFAEDTVDTFMFEFCPYCGKKIKIAPYIIQGSKQLKTRT